MNIVLRSLSLGLRGLERVVWSVINMMEKKDSHRDYLVLAVFFLIITMAFVAVSLVSAIVDLPILLDCVLVWPILVSGLLGLLCFFFGLAKMLNGE